VSQRICHRSLCLNERPPSVVWWHGRAMRRDPGGFYRLIWKVRLNPYLGAGHSFLSCSPGPPGVKQAPNHPGVEDGNMGTASRLPVLQAICGDRRRTDAGRSPRSSLRTGKPSTWRRGAEDRGVLTPGELPVYTGQGSIGLIPNVPRNMLSGIAEICRGLWRAGYIGKHVRPVR